MAKFVALTAVFSVSGNDRPGEQNEIIWGGQSPARDPGTATPCPVLPAPGNGSKGGLYLGRRLPHAPNSSEFPTNRRRISPGNRDRYASDQSGNLCCLRDCFAFQAHHTIDAVHSDKEFGPVTAKFVDGYRVAEIVDTALRSAKSGRLEKLQFRD